MNHYKKIKNTKLTVVLLSWMHSSAEHFPKYSYNKEKKVSKGNNTFPHE